MPISRPIASFVFCALFSVFAASAHAQTLGYIVNAADPTEDGTHDNLWRVDLSTGETQNIGPINLPSASKPQSDIEGLALRTSNVLYGVDDGIDSLVLIALATGSAQPLNRPTDNLRLDLRGNHLDPGLAFDCNGDTLMSSATRRTLYRLDRSTGEASAVGGEGRLGVKIGDITVRRDDVYGIGIDGDEGLYRINTSDGTAELIAPFDVDLRLVNVGIDMDSSGRIWAVGHQIDGDGQPQPSRIFRVNRETGSVTLGPTTKVGVKSLAIRPPSCNSDDGEPPRGTPEARAVPVGSTGVLAILVLSLLLVARRRLA